MKPTRINSPSIRSARGANWLLLAAAGIAWTGILIDLYFRFGLGTALTGFPNPGHFALLGVLSGIANIGWYARSDQLAPQWLLIGIQIVTGLVALYLIRLNTPAMMLIIGMAQIPARTSAVVIGTFFVITNLVLGLVLLTITATTTQAAVGWFLLVGFQLFALTVAVVQQRERMARETLARINAELVTTRRLLADSARAEERLRVSRELHDVAGHTLTAMTVSLEALSRKVPDIMRTQVLNIRDRSRELLDDIRAVVSHLRQHEFGSIHDAIDKLRERFPDVCIHLDTDEEVAINQIAAILRCVQEAVTNAVRHGKAENIWIRTKMEDSEITLTVRDDGTGGINYQSGNGLLGIGERLSSIGGRLDIQPSIKEGWIVEMRFPGSATTPTQMNQ